MASSDTDETLMCDYRDGDDGAFEALYQRHRGGLYRFILRQCPSKAVADELFQDVWMSIVRVRATYAVKAKFTTWLYQVARNRLIDYHRHQSIRAVEDAQTGSDEVDEPAAPAAEQPDRKTSAAQGIKKLLQLIEQLPQQQREAFLLREEAGMSVEEIALCTGSNAETAKSRLRYAVNKLRAGLGDHYE